MLFSLAASTLALSTALTIVTGAPLSPSTSGLIVSPASGTVIAPGSAFDFLYTTRADYGISSYNFTVMLLTTLPTSFATSDAFGTGYYFGRFAEPNYPGMPPSSCIHCVGFYSVLHADLWPVYRESISKKSSSCTACNARFFKKSWWVWSGSYRQ